MADNFSILDSSGSAVTLGAKDLSSVYFTKHITVDASGNIQPSADAAARALYSYVTNGTITLGVFAEDAAHSSGHTGIMPLAVRNDTHTTALSGTDGDYTPLAVDSTGKLGIRGTFAEDAAHTSGDLGVFMLAVRADTAAVTGGTDGDYVALITDSSGRLWTSATITSVVPGTGATSLGKAEDAAHTSGDVGVMALAVRSDAAAATAGTDGDYQPLITDDTGRLWTHVDAITAGETHIGEVATPRKVVSVTPTLDTNILAAGDAVGGKQTLTSAARVSGGTVTLESITVRDTGNQKAALTILFFDSDPTAATITNNAAFAWSTDISKCVGRVNIATADYETIDSEAIACVRGLNLTMLASGSANLYAAVVLTSGTPTYTAVGDLVFKYGFLQS